jgi:hypothetical protein
MIYFIEQEGIIKIGYSINPNKRFIQLKLSNPNELIVRLIIEGTLEDEKKYHEMFKEFHHRGEWFLFSDEIKEFIADKEKVDLRYDFGLLNNHAEIKTETALLRHKFSLTLREVGEKMNITAQSVKEIETRELTGTISLNVLRKYASSLGYRLVYKFVKCDEEELENEVFNLEE